MHVAIWLLVAIIVMGAACGVFAMLITLVAWAIGGGPELKECSHNNPGRIMWEHRDMDC